MYYKTNMNQFEDFGLCGELTTAIGRLGFTEPTQIQEEAIPPIMQGRDVIGESATGSGKTLAFGCGIIQQVVPNQGLQALILTPTRELAEQVRGAIEEFSYQKPLKIISVYGGVSIDPQINGLRSADVAVATPGRLLDHLQRGTIDTSRIKLLVLDEADRMLDMGFIEDVEHIIQSCPNKRQTLFFSATIPSYIRQLADRYMTEPIEVSAEKMVDPEKLKQVYYDVERNIKLSLLAHLLRNEKKGLVMVFCNTRRTTDFVVNNLRANRIRATVIHGGMTQNKRALNIKLFNDGRAGVLVCTDVAARGLHIDNVSHIYNYDIPKEPNDYVHRIGRTARAGEEGTVINLLCNYDYESFSRIVNEYSTFYIEKMERPYVERIVAIRESPRFRQGQRNQRYSRGRRPYRR